MFNEFDNFEPIDFFELSKILYRDYNNLKNSATKRIIYGRIYYSVFLFTREWLIENKDYKSNYDHENIPKALISKGPLDKIKNKQLSDDFRRLKKLRHQADYYLKIPKKGTAKYENWIFDNLEETFELAEDYFNSFK